MPLTKYFSDVVTTSAEDARSEANHRIANNLTLISGAVRMQADSVANGPDTLSREDVGMMLHEVSAQIEAIGRLHRLLSDTPEAEDVDCAEYLSAVCKCAPLTFAGIERARLTLDLAPNCRLAPSQVAPLGLIVTEIMINALKHAHPAKVAGEILIASRRDKDGWLRIEVADNGVGLPEQFDPYTDGGTGLRIMRALAKQLNTTPQFQTSDLGLSVRLRIPPVS